MFAHVLATLPKTPQSYSQTPQSYSQVAPKALILVPVLPFSQDPRRGHTGHGQGKKVRLNHTTVQNIPKSDSQAHTATLPSVNHYVQSIRDKPARASALTHM